MDLPPLTPYDLASRAVFAALDAGAIGTTEARRRLVAAGDTPDDAWFSLYVYHGGSRVTREEADGTVRFLSSGKTTDEVRRLMET